TAGAMNGTAGTTMTMTSGGAAGATSSAPDAGGSAGAAPPPVATPHCKRGEAYQSNSLNDLKTLSKGVSWWYNWTTSPEKSAGDYATAGVEFVPMIWGVKGGPPDPATIEKQIPKGAKYLLGFNEPNFAAQANITATDAAALWPRLEQIAKDMNLKIGSPAPNYCAGACNDTDPIHYLDTFFAACTGCQVDFIAAHWYACTGDALTHYLGLLKKYNKPIWLTEFSCMDAGDHSAAGEQTYMKTALQILENDPTIFRYSWFTGRWTDATVAISLLAGDGQLTDLGNLYVTSTATNVCGP
ncbi:MAG TPA: glycoside hydrolase family protein, partial [Polyangia bacterium]|nr:glycoside hydrolase family protein [Polyangia bacterium]